MNLRKYVMVFVALLSAVSLSLPHQALAQNTPVALKIVTVNISGIRAKALATKSINEQLIKVKDLINKQLQIEEKALRQANAELARKRTLLAPDAFAQERKKYEQRFVAFQRKRQESQKVMNEKVAKANNQLTRKMIDIIAKYAEDNQVSLVLPLKVTIFAAHAYNISNYVLDTLNKELPSVVITLPEK